MVWGVLLPRPPERRDPLDAVAVLTGVDMEVAAHVAPRRTVVFFVVEVNHAHRVFEIGDCSSPPPHLDYFQFSRPTPPCQGFVGDSQVFSGIEGEIHHQIARRGGSPVGSALSCLVHHTSLGVDQVVDLLVDGADRQHVGGCDRTLLSDAV